MSALSSSSSKIVPLVKAEGVRNIYLKPSRETLGGRSVCSCQGMQNERAKVIAAKVNDLFRELPRTEELVRGGDFRFEITNLEIRILSKSNNQEIMRIPGGTKAQEFIRAVRDVDCSHSDAGKAEDLDDELSGAEGSERRGYVSDGEEEVEGAREPEKESSTDETNSKVWTKGIRPETPRPSEALRGGPETEEVDEEGSDRDVGGSHLDADEADDLSDEHSVFMKERGKIDRVSDGEKEVEGSRESENESFTDERASEESGPSSMTMTLEEIAAASTFEPEKESPDSLKDSGEMHEKSEKTIADREVGAGGEEIHQSSDSKDKDRFTASFPPGVLEFFESTPSVQSEDSKDNEELVLSFDISFPSNGSPLITPMSSERTQVGTGKPSVREGKTSQKSDGLFGGFISSIRRFGSRKKTSANGCVEKFS